MESPCVDPLKAAPRRSCHLVAGWHLEAPSLQGFLEVREPEARSLQVLQRAGDGLLRSQPARARRKQRISLDATGRTRGDRNRIMSD